MIYWPGSNRWRSLVLVMEARTFENERRRADGSGGGVRLPRVAHTVHRSIVFLVLDVRYIGGRVWRRFLMGGGA